MIVWCSYCQQYQGECRPFDDHRITHGMCAACSKLPPRMLERHISQAQFLGELLDELRAAGWCGDTARAQRAVAKALTHNMPPVDVLMGLVGPLLREVCEKWKRDDATVADEHRFFETYDHLITLVEAAESVGTEPLRSADVLLVNARGNAHTLAIRLLRLWFTSRGIRTASLPAGARLVDEIRRLKPAVLGVSVALADHIPGALAVMSELSELSTSERPRVVIGGYAVRRDLVPPIDGARLMADAGELVREMRSEIVDSATADVLSRATTAAF